MRIFNKAQELKTWRHQLPQNKTVGFVPTMGALHAGHGELLKQSLAQTAETVLSIFVNPLQFNNSQDFQKYPTTLESDLSLARQLGVSAVFLPTPQEIYPQGYKYIISENSFAKILCGATRPGHFEGVLTVVLKLLQIIQPQMAFFGEKDFQQYLLIHDMVQDFFMDTQIVSVPTVREASGLAMSSRNLRLTSEQKNKAALIYKAITTASSAEEAKSWLLAEGFIVDYLEDHKGRRFVAAFLDEVRLIDNVSI